MFGQNTETSNSGWQLFGNLKENNPSVENNNNLLSSSVNLFNNLGEFNPLLNNNNNLPPERLNPNVAALVNTLTEMNLTKGYYSRERSFIKLTEFEGIETEDLNKWLERFNRIAKANQ